MKIGIDGSRAFLAQRTGIEEYSYQVIRHLASGMRDEKVVLYLRKGQCPDFPLPKGWKMKTVFPSRFWTQLGLSLEMLLHPVDALFIPAHTVPAIHPKNTFVTVHGLEFEVMPEAYSFWERIYMRLSIRRSCIWAKKVISVSRNTRNDLVSLYDIPEEKIDVIYEGYDDRRGNGAGSGKPKAVEKPYFLFVGRLERRKNISNIVRAFEIMKAKHRIPHKLVLAGRPGFGYAEIRKAIDECEFRGEIEETGFVSAGKKRKLISGASVFLFPTLYEGFGLPVLEAQSAGVPVVSSNVSSLPEVCNGSALLVDPQEPEFIAEAAYSLVSDKVVAKELVRKGYENVKRFSWEKCAGLIRKIIEGEG